MELYHWGMLNKRNIARGMCFFCSMELEHSRQRFLSCPMARMVWRCINLVWMQLIGVRLSSFNWVFAHNENSERMPHFQIIFELLRYSGLWFNWNMWNAFTFDSQVGVRKYVVNLKVLLLWQLTVLEKSPNLNHEERELQKVTYHHIHHLNWSVGRHCVCSQSSSFKSLEGFYTCL